MNLWRLNKDLHRDVGYFLSGLIFVYCISGIALNHVDAWNPDFIIQKRSIVLEQKYGRDEITPERVAEFAALVGESKPRVQDFPTPEQVKLYFDNASLLVNFVSGIGTYERVTRRPLFYEANVLHRNSLKGWKWASDVFGGLLIFLTVSGWFMIRGRFGTLGRGKWLIAAGAIPPIVAIVLFQVVQK